MNFYSEWVSVAVVFAMNLLVVGVILTGGLALVCRLLENIVPRVRYVIAVAVFLLTILIPATISLEQPLGLSLTGQAQNAVGPANQLASVPDSKLAGTVTGPAICSPTDGSVAALPNQLSALFINSPLASVFLGLWFFGTAFLGLRELAGLVHFRRTQSRWERATPAEHEELGCPANVSLYLTDTVSPGTVGLLFPAIVIPRHFPGELSMEAKRLVIQHELSHVRWRDPLLGLILRSLRALLWVSPALWLIGRIIERERETAADRAAVSSRASRFVRDDCAFAYAETLMVVAQYGLQKRQRSETLQTIGLGGRTGQLEMRIYRVLFAAPATRRQWAGAIAVFIITVAVLLLTPFATPSVTTTNSVAVIDESSVISFSDSDGVQSTHQSTEAAVRTGPPRSSSRISPRPVHRPNGASLAPISYERMVGLSGLRGELAPLRELSTGP